MNFLLVVLYLLLAAAGASVVLTRDPLRQSLVASEYGMLLSLLFLALQAPDVCLSEIVVGAVIFPLMVLLALTKVKGSGAQ